MPVARMLQHANNSVFNLHFMKVSIENDNNFEYDKITIVVDNLPLNRWGNIPCRIRLNRNIPVTWTIAYPRKHGCCSMDVKIRVCLSRKYGRFMLSIDNNMLLPGARLHILNNIYRK
jgi:hypothetical protein